MEKQQLRTRRLPSPPCPEFLGVTEQQRAVGLEVPKRGQLRQMISERSEIAKSCAVT